MRTFSRAVLAALAVLLFTPIFVSPSFADVVTGDVLVADLGNCTGQDVCEPGTGSIRHYSASGAEDPAPFASGLSAPWSITADQLGNIYVSERDGQRVTKFSPSGTNLLTITTGFTPGGVRVAPDGTIYVVDSLGGKINRYSASGTDLGRFASTELVSADFMTFDAQGNLYVTGADSANVNNEVVRRFSPAGADNFVAGFFAPAGIAFDAQGNLYVASSTSHFVEQYSSSGTDLGTFAFGDPAGVDAFRGIAFDASGNLYVANSAGRNILRFPPAGGAAAPEPFASGLGFPWDLVIVTMPSNPTDPTIKTECKEDGWLSFDFKNQGDCIQFVNTGE
jgi:sugar lactone lactonase YvrE